MDHQNRNLDSTAGDRPASKWRPLSGPWPGYFRYSNNRLELNARIRERRDIPGFLAEIRNALEREFALEELRKQRRQASTVNRPIAAPIEPALPWPEERWQASLARIPALRPIAPGRRELQSREAG